MTSWYELITNALKLKKETWADVDSTNILKEDLNAKFENAWGCEKGISFNVWTKNNVYYPHDYDGKVSVRSVPRNPINTIPWHNGINVQLHTNY
jgi:hypothetical protein